MPPRSRRAGTRSRSSPGSWAASPGGGLDDDVDAPVLAHVELLGEQRVDRVEGADLAVLEAPDDRDSKGATSSDP